MYLSAFSCGVFNAWSVWKIQDSSKPLRHCTYHNLKQVIPRHWTYPSWNWVIPRHCTYPNWTWIIPRHLKYPKWNQIILRHWTYPNWNQINWRHWTHHNWSRIMYVKLYVFQCYKWFWSCLPLWTAACLHSVSYTTIFFWHPHAENPTIQTQDSWIPHLLFLRTPHFTSLALDPTFGIDSHKTLVCLDTAQPFHLLKPNLKPLPFLKVFSSQLISIPSFCYSRVCVWCVVHVFVFLYNTLCKLFWWDCAVHVYRMSYLG